MRLSLAMIQGDAEKVHDRQFVHLEAVEENSVLMFDEAFDVLSAARVKFDTSHNLDGILGVGKLSKRIVMFSGVRGTQTESVLKVLFDSVAAYQFKSTNALLKWGDQPCCQVET